MSEKFEPKERIARLRLIRSDNIGPITFHRLIETYQSAADALEALPQLAAKGGLRRKPRICPSDAAEEELERTKAANVRMVHFGEAGYPPLLAHIPDAPPVLFVKGQHRLLGKKSLAVVGARNASLNGQKIARSIAAELGKNGFLIVSGLARGIDAAAHEGALETGTLAVVGGGVDVVYPRENENLHQRMCEVGAICSEMPLGITPQASHFPRRNRIISGITRGIVVIEAGAKSGSLITAKQALEQGRDVFAVPGSPADPRVKGTNMLIRDGAYLTENATDVIDVLGIGRTLRVSEGRQDVVALPPIENDKPNDPVARDALLSAIGFTPTFIDDVIRDTKQSPSAVAAALLELEVAGRLERLPGGYVVQVTEQVEMHHPFKNL